MNKAMGKPWMIIEKTIYAVILCFLPFLHVSQGIDFTDTGYSIMLFANGGEKFSYWMLSTCLSNWFGAVLMKLPRGNTYLGIKIYCLCVLAAMVLGLYYFLSRNFHYRAVFAGLIPAILARWCPACVLYNYLSYLLLYAAVIFILVWCEQRKDRYLIIAGVLLGLNVFTRISNITQVILIIPVVFAAFLYREKVGKTVKLVLKCMAGFFVGLLVPFMVLFLRHGFMPFIQAYKMLTAMSKGQNGYSGLTMLSTYPELVLKYKTWLFLLILMIGIGILASIVCRKRILRILLAVCVLGGLGIWFRFAHYWSVFTVHDYSSYLSTEFVIFLAVMMAAGLSLAVLFWKKADVLDRCYAAICLCVLFIAPLGTNTGFLAVMNNLYFILPVTAGLAWKNIFMKDSRFLVPVKVMASVIFAVALVQCFLFSVTFVYGENSSSECTARIKNNSFLRNVESSEGMVMIMEGISEFAAGNSFSGRSCITFGNIPIMPFVLDMPTAISTSWPDLDSYPLEEMKRELSLISDGERPVIILNKWYFYGKDIFDEEIQAVLPKNKVLADYLTDHQYALQYENDKFQVYDIEE